MSLHRAGVIGITMEVAAVVGRVKEEVAIITKGAAKEMTEERAGHARVAGAVRVEAAAALEGGAEESGDIEKLEA